MYKLRSLKVWGAASRLAREAYRLTLTRPLDRHFSLADQIRRAAISIPANLAEGYGLGTTPQLLRCTRIALGSAYELQIHLELVRDLELVETGKSATVEQLADETIRMLIGMLKGLGRK